MLTVEEISQNIVRQLRLLDPSASAEIGTPERKIIESVAEIIAQFQVDFSVLQRQHDITTMTGNRLDSYLGNYGFQRQLSAPATGDVRFERDTPATEAITIPRGTQVKAVTDTSDFPDVGFTTLATVVIPVGETSVTAPVIATIPGSIGNVAAGAITGFAGLRSVSGITTITNDDPMTGGVDGEDDTQLKLRFKNSLFRNMAGTYDQFLALAVSAPTVTKANIIGPVSRFQEYVQVPLVNDASQITRVITGYSGGVPIYAVGGYDSTGTNWPHKRTTSISTIPYSKYTYLEQFYLGEKALNPCSKFYRHGVDFVFNAPPLDPTSNPQAFDVSEARKNRPNITILGRTVSGSPKFPEGLEPGNIVLLEHAYISTSSRNNYDLGILNAVDIFVNGGSAQSCSSIEVVPGNSNKLQNTDAGKWTYQLTGQTPSSENVINFRRMLDGRASRIGNIIQPMYWQPVMTVPDKITISGNTYYRANHYWSTSEGGDNRYYNRRTGSGTTGSPYVYSLPAHYCAVEEVNGYYGTIRARNGIEWFTSGTAGVGNYLKGKKSSDSGNNYTGKYITDAAIEGTQFTLPKYTYDANISNLQAVVEKQKQVTTDVLVHRAKNRFFKCYLTIMYTPGSTQSVVNASINTALSVFFSNQYYGAAIQLSDILQTVHNVPGVDNVRWTADVTPSAAVWKAGGSFDNGEYVRPTAANDTGLVYLVSNSGGTAGSTEPTWPTTIGATSAPDSNGLKYKAVGIRYRVEEVRADGNSLEEGAKYFYNDFFIQDNELANTPSANQTVLTIRAQNTWVSL